MFSHDINIWCCLDFFPVLLWRVFYSIRVGGYTFSAQFYNRIMEIDQNKRVLKLNLLLRMRFIDIFSLGNMLLYCFPQNKNTDVHY